MKSQFSFPALTPFLSRRLIERIDNFSWFLNRYSLELNFKHDQLKVVDFMALARKWGFDGVQLHVAKGGSRVSLAGESDAYLKALADQDGERKLDIQIDVSSTAKEDIEDVVDGLDAPREAVRLVPVDKAEIEVLLIVFDLVAEGGRVLKFIGGDRGGCQAKKDDGEEGSHFLIKAQKAWVDQGVRAWVKLRLRTYED